MQTFFKHINKINNRIRYKQAKISYPKSKINFSTCCYYYYYYNNLLIILFENTDEVPCNSNGKFKKKEYHNSNKKTIKAKKSNKTINLMNRYLNFNQFQE